MPGGRPVSPLDAAALWLGGLYARRGDTLRLRPLAVGLRPEPPEPEVAHPETLLRPLEALP